MANSYAFVLSKNTYPDAFQANLIGVDQGTRIVYSATNTLTSESVLYADSRLTQPIYGNPDLWLGVQLLTDDNVKYPINVSTSGSIEVGSVTTTTTTTVPATTTTTTIGYNIYPVVINGGNVCGAPGTQVSIGGNVSADSTIYGDFGASGYPGGSLIWVRYVDNAITYARQFYVNLNETSADYMNLQSTC